MMTYGKWSLLALPLCLLAGCGGQADSAAAACEAAVAERMSDGDTFSVDRAALAASAREDSDDALLLQSGIVIKPGLPSEYKQTIDCRVRFDDGVPSVISLTFVY